MEKPFHSNWIDRQETSTATFSKKISLKILALTTYSGNSSGFSVPLQGSGFLKTNANVLFPLKGYMTYKCDSLLSTKQYDVVTPTRKRYTIFGINKFKVEKEKKIH